MCMNVTDSGLAAWLMGADREAVKLDGAARGRILDMHNSARRWRHRPGGS